MSDTRHLSHSQLSMLFRCGEQYRRRYVEGERLAPGMALVVGRAVDKSVTENLAHKMAEGSLLPLDAVRGIARDDVQAIWDGEEGVALSDEEKSEGAAKVKGDAIDKSVRLAELHARKLAPSLSPTAVQRKWEVSLEQAGYPATLVGVIDIQEGRESIRDTKTASKSPSADAAHLSDQLTLYALAVKVVDGALPSRLALDFLVDTKEPKVVPLETSRTEADFGPVLRRVERALQVIDAGAFAPANPDDWWCSKRWCGYWETCPLVRRGATVAITQ